MLGSNKSGFSTDNSNTTLYTGFKNDNEQGDFIRVFTRSFVCTGSINGAADDYTICRDATAQFSVDTIIPGYNYSWLPTTGLSNPNIHNPVYSFCYAFRKAIVML